MRRAYLVLFLLSPLIIAEKKVITPEGVSRSTSPLNSAIEADGLIYVSGMVGRDPKGQFARGDVRTQTRQTLDNIGAALKAAGVTFQHVVSTTLYLADIRFLDAADEIYRQYFAREFPARTTLESLLMAPEALVEISAIAVRDPAKKRIVRSPEGWPDPKQPVNYAVEAGNTLFLSSIHASDPRTGALAGDTIQLQVERVMKNQQELLSAAGMSFADLVFTRIYLADPSAYAGLNEAYGKFVTAAPPARATVHAFPVHAGHLVQIQPVAVKGSGEGRPTGAGWTSPVHSFSVATGRRLYVAGMTGRGPDGKFAPDIKAQTRQALATIDLQLKKHGMTFADAVDSVVWLRDARDFAGMNEVYRQYVTPDPPARATVRIAPNSPEALVEIMMVAVK